MDLNSETRRAPGQLIKPTPQYKDANNHRNNNTDTNNNTVRHDDDDDVDENNNNVENIDIITHDDIKHENTNGDSSPVIGSDAVVSNGNGIHHRKGYSPDHNSDNVSRISSPGSIVSPATPQPAAPVPASVAPASHCKCGCMESVGSPAMAATNGTVVVYQKEVV